MSEHIFNVGPGHLPAEAQRIAERYGAVLVNYRDAHGRKKHWFASENKGEPFDGEVQRAVEDDLRAALY